MEMWKGVTCQKSFMRVKVCNSGWLLLSRDSNRISGDDGGRNWVVVVVAKTNNIKITKRMKQKISNK
jgi:hypothetical protein